MEQLSAKLVLAIHKQSRTELAQLRGSVREMSAGVAKLTSTLVKIEERHASHKDDIARIEVDQKDHESRIRDVEKNQWKFIGIAIGVSAITSLGFTVGSLFFR